MATIENQGLAYITYTVNGSEDTFQFFFDYIDEEHVEVYSDGDKIDPLYYTILTGGFVKTSTPPLIGRKLRIERVTPSDEIMAVFSNQSSINKEDLNLNGTQVLYVMQEVLDEVYQRLPVGGDDTQVLNNLDMNGFRILELGDGIDDTDAVNLGQVKNLLAGVQAGVQVTEEEIIAYPGQTVFELQKIKYTPGYNTISVYVDGIYQGKIDYLEMADNKIEFDEPANGYERYNFLHNASPANSISIVQADIDVLGGVILATDAEALAGENRLKAITPATLKYTLERYLPQDATQDQKGVVQLAEAGERFANDIAATPASVESQIDENLSETFIVSFDEPVDGDGRDDGTVVFVISNINPL